MEKRRIVFERNTISGFREEPYSVDERLLYHVSRAIIWLESAAQNKLVLDNELFELPDFSLAYVSEIQFAFSENCVTYMQWQSTNS